MRDERDCNSCKHHVQGDAILAHCRDCLNRSGYGSEFPNRSRTETYLPHWEPKEAPVETIEVSDVSPHAVVTDYVEDDPNVKMYARQTVGAVPRMRCPGCGVLEGELHIKSCYLAKPADKAKTYDDGKAPLAVLPWAALDAIAMVQAYGHKKYGDFYNYRKGMEVSRNLSCAIRHIRDYMNGHDKDHESGQNPLAHAAIRIAFVLQNLADGTAIDDRYKGRAA